MTVRDRSGVSRDCAQMMALLGSYSGPKVPFKEMVQTDTNFGLRHEQRPGFPDIQIERGQG